MSQTNETSAHAGEQLRAALTERGAAAKLARDLNVDQSQVTRWIQRTRSPNTAQRVHIEREFGIPILAWDLDEPTEGAAE